MFKIERGYPLGGINLIHAYDITCFIHFENSSVYVEALTCRWQHKITYDMKYMKGMTYTVQC